MTKLLVVNHAHSIVCGIYDLGARIDTLLRTSSKLEVRYAACEDAGEYVEAVQMAQPDAIIVNYRQDLMPWVSRVLGVTSAAKRFAIAHNYDAATVDRLGPEAAAAGFDYVLALDPQLKVSDPRIIPVGRAIPLTVDHGGERSFIPQIGSFGFAFPHKNFQAVAKEIDDSCNAAVFNLHMPEAYFNGVQGQPFYAQGIVDACHAQITKRDIRLRHTSEHLAEADLIRRLSLNEVNCLFYVPGQTDAGLSSALDYLIAARRPVLLSGCAMFRHAWNAPIWPDTHLDEILGNYDYFQREADVLYESHAGRFTADIEALMERVL